MAASVQDLLLAAQSKGQAQQASPIANLLTSFLGGVQRNLPSGQEIRELEKERDELNRQKERERTAEQTRLRLRKRKDLIEETKIGPKGGVTTVFKPRTGKEANEIIGVEQIMALQSGDPVRIQAAFPLGVPEELATSAIKEGVRFIKEEKKMKTRQENIAVAGRTVVQDINRGIEVLERNIDRFGPTTAAGPLAVVNKFIPGSDAHTLERFAESVKSNISIDRLQAMREASPTGGALGQIPVQQQKFLMQLLGSLDVVQKPAVLLDNMRRIYNIYNDLIHGFGSGPDRFDLTFDDQGFSTEKPTPWRGVELESQETPGVGIEPLGVGSVGIPEGFSFEVVD